MMNDLPFLQGIKKTLVLREIPEDGIKKLLSTKESLASCDIAVFVYDSSDEYSLKRTSELLMDVARQGEVTGLSVPCLFIAAKDDLDSYPIAIKDSTQICQYFGVDSPIHISVKERDLNSVFSRIVSAAEHPHLSVPETEVGRNQKRYHQLINRSLMVASVAAAIGIVGMAAYRSYIARKNTSG
nr:mitochondrial Rho GTPase 1-like [Ipomoea batatas]GMD80962.1 mitochondrial Rho GTPase 1-like [Ipomoea batatas]